jgi:hypothetical protein
MIGERRRTVSSFCELGTENVCCVSPVVSSQVRHGYADAELNLDVCGGIQSVGEMVSSFRSSLSG